MRTVTESSRGPGWREAFVIAAGAIAAVFALELASAVMPPVHDAFASLPITIVALVAATIGVLVLTLRGRPR
jgi:hypothetical protein